MKTQDDGGFGWRSRREQSRAAASRPRHVADVLRNHLARRGYAQQRGTADLVAMWRRIVREPLAAQSHPVGLRAGVLEVVCTHASVLQELNNFHKAEILRSFAQQWPQAKVRDIRFRAGTVPADDSNPTDDAVA